MMQCIPMSGDVRNDISRRKEMNMICVIKGHKVFANNYTAFCNRCMKKIDLTKHGESQS